MAPALVESPVAAPHTLAGAHIINKALFPDGLKTSGQHSPIFSRLRPYSDFPTEISGPTVWKAEDYCNNPERWTHIFSDEEIAELGKAADDFISSKRTLTGITKSAFPLPTLSPLFAAIRKELLNGKGFILFKGIPVREWGLEKSAVCQLRRRIRRYSIACSGLADIVRSHIWAWAHTSGISLVRIDTAMSSDTSKTLVRIPLSLTKFVSQFL